MEHQAKLKTLKHHTIIEESLFYGYRLVSSNFEIPLFSILKHHEKEIYYFSLDSSSFIPKHLRLLEEMKNIKFKLDYLVSGYYHFDSLNYNNFFHNKTKSVNDSVKTIMEKLKREFENEQVPVISYFNFFKDFVFQIPENAMFKDAQELWHLEKIKNNQFKDRIKELKQTLL